MHEILQAKILEQVAIPHSRDLPDPGYRIPKYAEQRLGWDHSKPLITNRAFLCGSAVKNLPAVQEIRF